MWPANQTTAQLVRLCGFEAVNVALQTQAQRHDITASTGTDTTPKLAQRALYAATLASGTAEGACVVADAALKALDAELWAQAGMTCTTQASILVFGKDRLLRAFETFGSCVAPVYVLVRI